MDYDEPTTYLQVFRSGAIEAVDGNTLDGPEKLVTGGLLVDELVGGIVRYLELLRLMKMRPPIFGMVTLVGVKGFRLRPATQFVLRGYAQEVLDRDELALPDVVFDRLDADVPTTMRPAFDALWQALGHPRCPYYDAKGAWKPPS